MTTPLNDAQGTSRPTPPSAHAIAAGAPVPAPMSGLFCELHWGPELTTVRSFDATVLSVRAAPDERAPVPLYGFQIPDTGWTLAERTPAGSYVIFPPPGAVARRQRQSSAPETVALVPGPEGRPSLTLAHDERITLSIPDRELRIELFPSIVKQRVEGLPLQRKLGVIVAIAAAFTLPLGFIFVRPDAEAIAIKNEQTLEQVRQVKEAQRRELEERYPTYVDENAKPVRPEDGITLPTSFTVQ